MIGNEYERTECVQAQLTAIIKSSTDAIISMNLDGIVTSWNPAAETIYGYPPQEILGHPLRKFMALECGDEDAQSYGGIHRDERTEHYETLQRRKNGDVFRAFIIASPIKDPSGAVDGVIHIVRDISSNRQRDIYRSMGQDILRALNDQSDTKEAIRKIIAIIKSTTGVEAVGMRLQDNDDYPYFWQDGFTQEFLQKENSLLSRNRDAGICGDGFGNVSLDCTCGLVISGRTDPSNSLFTKRGSFWTNNSIHLLKLSPDLDLRSNPRNECIHQGFASVALIPIRAKGCIVGLLQLNDRRRRRFTLDGISILEDIAENIGEAMLRKQTESELRKSKDLVVNILQNTDQGIYGTDMDGRCTFINRAALTMLGYTEDDCVGRNMHDLIHYRDVSGAPYMASDCPICRARALGESFHVDNEVLWRADGTSFFVEYSTHPIVEHGTASGAVITFSDISVRKRNEEERNKLESQLHQAQKLESIGGLAGGVAHDFNNKLSIILSHTHLLLTRSLSAQVRDSLDEIRKATEQSADLTRQLLAFARKQTIEPKVLDLNETIPNLLNMLRRLIGEDLQLVWRPADNLWKIKVDPSQIDQILANLCINARDAIAGIGKVTIETENRSFDEHYCTMTPGFVAGDYVQIAVSDNGCGMDRETQMHIFEPFFTTKPVGKGTGLGLATVYGIVKQNSGFITIYSELGIGTTFKIFLPRFADQEQPVHRTSPVRQSLQGRGTILLVEDEPSMLEITAVLLKKLGYNVLTAETPGRAIELAEQFDGEIHLLMTDVIMPEMNGRDLARTIQRLRPRLNCLYMSGYTANVIAHHGILDDGIHFIAKPFSLQGLTDKLIDVLDGS